MYIENKQKRLNNENQKKIKFIKNIKFYLESFEKIIILFFVLSLSNYFFDWQSYSFDFNPEKWWDILLGLHMWLIFLFGLYMWISDLRKKAF